MFSLHDKEDYIEIVIVPNMDNAININICSMYWINSYNQNTHLEIIYTFPLSFVGLFIQSGKISTFSSEMMSTL